jgi:hypothetical protein
MICGGNLFPDALTHAMTVVISLHSDLLAEQNLNSMRDIAALLSGWSRCVVFPYFFSKNYLVCPCLFISFKTTIFAAFNYLFYCFYGCVFIKDVAWSYTRQTNLLCPA